MANRPARRRQCAAPFLLCFIALMGAGCAQRTGLGFDPKSVSVGGRVPGTWEFTALLRNDSDEPQSGLSAHVSCGCMTLLSPRGPFDIPPSGSVKVAFRMVQSKPINVNQAVNISEGSSPVPIVTLPVIGQLQDIFANQSWQAKPIDIHRVFNSESARVTTGTCSIISGVKVISCTPGVSWVETSFKQDGYSGKLSLTVGPGAPDGDTEIPLAVVYEASGGKAECEMAIPVKITSKYTVSDPVIWLGLAKKGQVITRDVVVSGANAAALRFVAQDSWVSVEVAGRDAGRVKLHLVIRPESSGKLLKTRVQIVGEGGPSGYVEIGGVLRG